MSCSRSQSSKVKGCPHSKSLSPSNLGEVVSDYQGNHDLHRTWNRELSIPEAVFGYPLTPSLSTEPKDILDTKDWKSFLKEAIIHPHQQRTYVNQDLQAIAEHLARHWKRNSFKDFEDLYDYISSLLVNTATNNTGLVKNPYALIIYDIALRLAIRFGVWPKDYVYLNGNGPFEAAKALGVGKRGRILYSDIITRYPELGKLDAAELEDFLCVYKKEIKGLQMKGLL